MINTTQWTPDTCKCVFVYEWNTDEPEATRVHTPISVNTCTIHTQLTDAPSAYAAVLQENTGKNRAYNDACLAVPALLPENFAYSFDDSRNLIITLQNVSDVDVATVQAALVTKHPTVSITLAQPPVLETPPIAAPSVDTAPIQNGESGTN